MATTPDTHANVSDPPDLTKNAPAPISEADLARALGVARDDLKKLRAALIAEDDWTGGNGKPVLITASGQKKLAALMVAGSAETGTCGPVASAVTASQRPDRYVSLIIVRQANPRVLWAKKEGASDKDVVRVMTRVSPHFRPGMLLERCEISTTTPGVFYYHGRLPRRAGKF